MDTLGFVCARGAGGERISQGFFTRAPAVRAPQRTLDAQCF